MTPQILLDGVLTGAMLGLGAVGLTLTYAILRFANFAQGEFVTAGAYAALVASWALGGVVGDAPLGEFTFGWRLIAALPAAMLAGAVLAVLLEAVFRRLRARGNAIGLVIASFGASMAIRSLIEFGFGPQPRYYSHEIAMAVRLAPHFAPGLRASWDQMGVLATAFVLMAALQLVLRHTWLGRAMRAVSENPALARIGGIDVERVILATWAIGGALAAASGVLLGVLVQVRPYMGFDTLLPLFAAAILGGIGSVPGALAGGLLVGVAEAAAVPIAGAQYRAAVAFLVLLAVLLLRPQGLFGRAA